MFEEFIFDFHFHWSSMILFSLIFYCSTFSISSKVLFFLLLQSLIAKNRKKKWIFYSKIGIEFQEKKFIIKNDDDDEERRQFHSPNFRVSISSVYEKCKERTMRMSKLLAIKIEMEKALKVLSFFHSLPYFFIEC